MAQNSRNVGSFTTMAPLFCLANCIVLLTAGFCEFSRTLAFQPVSIDFVTVGVTNVMSLTHSFFFLLEDFLLVVVSIFCAVFKYDAAKVTLFCDIRAKEGTFF